MKILQWTTEETAQSFLDSCNANANLPQQVSLTIQEVRSHTTDTNIWWMYRTPLEDHDYANGGVAANTILIDSGLVAEDFIELEKTEQELIDDGYEPDPTA